VGAAPGRLVLEVSPSGDGLLVVSQPFYPGWRARVDGKQAPIYRADYLLQAIPVSADTHRVELTYRLSPWPGIVSLTALVVCIVGLVGKRRPPHGCGKEVKTGGMMERSRDGEAERISRRENTPDGKRRRQNEEL
jgi:hypothetical protein